MNTEIKLLFDEDQYECINQPPDGTQEFRDLRERIKERLKKLKGILDSNCSLTGIDYFHACLLCLHGDCPEDFWLAYQLGLKSVKLSHKDARKYTAAAYDKYLMYQGKPQKFGLQYVPDGVRLRLWDVDPTTTDEERAEWDVPPLQKLYALADEATEKIDMTKIVMDNKPQWLKDAIKRWNHQ